MSRFLAESFDCGRDHIAAFGALVEAVARRLWCEALDEAYRFELPECSCQVRAADRLDLLVEFCRGLGFGEGTECCGAVGACPDVSDEVPRCCHLVPGNDTWVLYRGLTTWCLMVPSADERVLAQEDVVIVAALSRADWCRLHSLLCCFESPFRTPGEGVLRLLDEGEHERLRREIALLLQE